jgi:sugar/nucleoside kinase (ribokinase family)
VTRAVVLGDALLDVVARPSAPPHPGADVPAAIGIGAGGQGANLAVRLARLGVETELVCGLADDPPGEILRRSLTDEGVGLSPVTVGATGTVVILLDAAGERTMLSRRAPFASAVAAAATALRPSEAEWIVVSGYLLLEADARALAGSLAAGPGRRVLVGCAVPADARDGWLAAATALRPDLVILNRDESVALDAGSAFPAAVAVTDATGAVATIGAVSAAARVPTAGPALDTTGAGDAFAAGLIAALSRAAWPPSASELQGALAAAAELASSVTHVPGAQGRVAGELGTISSG